VGKMAFLGRRCYPLKKRIFPDHASRPSPGFIRCREAATGVNVAFLRIGGGVYQSCARSAIIGLIERKQPEESPAPVAESRAQAAPLSSPPICSGGWFVKRWRKWPVNSWRGPAMRSLSQLTKVEASHDREARFSRSTVSESSRFRRDDQRPFVTRRSSRGIASQSRLCAGPATPRFRGTRVGGRHLGGVVRGQWGV
jgi:hypothetical protein